MVADAYTVRLDAFSGPLDLLLHLIQRAEIDITTIAIAQITDQFLEHISAIEHIDVEGAAEFLVVAATLIEVKSRALAPRDDSGEATHFSQRRREPMDPAEALVRQLLAYRSYRGAATSLGQLREAWRKRTALRPIAIGDLRGTNDDEPALDLEDVGLFDLTRAYGRLAETVEFARLGDHTIERDERPIEQYAQEITDRLGRLHVADGAIPSMPLRAIFDGKDKGDVIGLFLAILELVRGDSVGIVAKNGDVILELRERTQDPAF